MKLKLELRKKSLIFCLIIISICSVLFQFSALKNILYKVYKWQLAQPESINGLLELFIVAIIFCVIIFIIKSRWSTLLIIIVCGIFLQIHGVLLSAMLCLIYFESIMSIGRSSISFLFKKKERNLEYLSYFLVGLLIWSFVSIVSSLFGFGGINDLRIVTIILVLISFINGFNTPFVVHIFKKYKTLTKYEKLPASFLLLLILIQFAKSNTLLANEFDSVWYGLRPEAVLVGGDSFFDNLGFLSFVHFYPKLFELFLLPMSNLGSYKYILSVNVMILSILMYLMIYFFKEMKTNKVVSLFYTCLIASTPVISNMASTAKSDISSTFLLVLGVYYIWNWILETSKPNVNIKSEYLWFATIAFVLSLGGKPTSIVYVPFIILGLALYIIINKKEFKHNNLINIVGFNLRVFVLFVLSLLVYLGVCYRTYKITGFPIYPTLGNLWSHLGFEGKYPHILKNVGEFAASFEIRSFITRWYHMFFDPQPFGHVIMLWIGNLSFLLVGLFILIFGFKIKSIEKNNFLFLVSPICLLGIYYATIIPNGGDGNTYMVPLILGMIGLLTFMHSLLVQYNKMLLISLLLFIPIQTLVMFVSHPSWSYGMSPVNFTYKDVNNTKEIKNKMFEYHGLSEIEKYLNNTGSMDRCIGYGDDYLLNQLACGMETVNASGNDYLGNSKIFSDLKSLNEYITWSKVKYIILPNTVEESKDPIYKLLDEFRKTSNQNGQVLSGEKYDLILIDTKEQ
ncbi:hypothetical protein [Paenibacillus sp. NRS-1760]|uniref:hypothetical protein n=1 Tax=Paenibacillus sp. NRS-1760 TaxID=3233902 RepID=UPI003D2DF9E4